MNANTIPTIEEQVQRIESLDIRDDENFILLLKLVSEDGLDHRLRTVALEVLSKNESGFDGIMVQIAIEDHDKDVSIAALRILIETGASHISINRMRKDSDKEAHAATVGNETLRMVDIIATIARKNPSKEVRLAALEELDIRQHVELITGISKRSLYRDIRLAAHEKLGRKGLPEKDVISALMASESA